MHVIDLSYFVKIYRSKNKHISVNFLRHLHRAGDLHLSGTTRCIYEDVIMKKCLTLLIATVLSGISLTAYAAQPMSNTGQRSATARRYRFGNWRIKPKRSGG